MFYCLLLQITMNPTVGELLQAVRMPENTFNERRAKLSGMNETVVKAMLPSAASDEQTVKKRVYEAANVMQVPSTEEGDEPVLKFAGRTLAGSADVLVLLRIRSEQAGNDDEFVTLADIFVHCEKIVIGSMLSKELKNRLEAVQV